MHRLLITILLGLTSISPTLAQVTPERFTAGVHYFAIEPAQPTARDRIEVIEVFSYACHACATFQTHVDKWKKRLPAEVSFSYMPSVWSAPWETMGRAYYAAQALGVIDQTHGKFFHAIYSEKKPLSTLDEIARWVEATAGIKAADFTAAAKSSGVNIKIARAKQLVPRYGVESTPTVIVAGKYRVSGRSAGDWDTMLQVVDFLVARESAARRTTP